MDRWISKAPPPGRPVDSFDKVELRGSGDLTISIGEETSVVVQADSAIMDRVTTTVDDGTLVLDQSGVNFGLFEDGPAFDVTVAELAGVTLSGSGRVAADGLEESILLDLNGSGDMTLGGAVENLEVVLEGHGHIDATDLTARSVSIGAGGSGEIEVAVEGTRLDAAMGGSMTVTARGTVDEAVVTIDGSGNFVGRDLSARSAVVDIPGSASADISVEERLEVTISGSGEVTYHGDPEVSEDISGSGSVQQG